MRMSLDPLTFCGIRGPVSYTHLDVYKRQPWETINGSHLSEMGYAVQYDPTVPLILQIEKCLQTTPKQTICDVQLWEKNLHKHIDKLRFEPVSYTHLSGRST